MSYAILTAETLPAYIRSQADRLPAWFAAGSNAGAALSVTELSDGNLNAVYRVRTPTSSLLVKQGLPYLRVAGASWPLSSDRAALEARALTWQQRLAPGLVPEPYFFDSEMCVNLMEDLRDHRVVRQPMIGRLEIQALGATIGDFLARMLFGTSDFALQPGEKKRLQAEFINAELCEITEDLIFTEPFERELLNGKQNRNRFDPGIARALETLQANQQVRLEVARLKHRFMTAGQALLHGDLHTGSIMATLPDPGGRSDIRVIDPEFAFFGPMGFDVGLFLANLYLNAAAQRGHAPSETETESYRAYLFSQARDCWQTFADGFRTRLEIANSVSWRGAGFADAFLIAVLRDATGFAGCETIRRSVGFAHVLDVDSIADEQMRVSVLENNLRVGTRLILGRHQINEYADLERLVMEGRV